jgi:phosphoribosylaminoimidazole-succinocarboxamide synthase
MSPPPLLHLDLPGLKKVRSGKVREMFDLGDRLLMVATDRISAFDCVMPNGIPRKGEILTQISSFGSNGSPRWCRIICSRARTIHCRRCSSLSRHPLRAAHDREEGGAAAIECVVRGFLAGSGWKEYQKSRTVCGLELPAGLVESSELPEPISPRPPRPRPGTDENISFARAAQLIGADLAERARRTSLELYATHATTPGRAG